MRYEARLYRKGVEYKWCLPETLTFETLTFEANHNKEAEKMVSDFMESQKYNKDDYRVGVHCMDLCQDLSIEVTEILTGEGG